AEGRRVPGVADLPRETRGGGEPLRAGPHYSFCVKGGELRMGGAITAVKRGGAMDNPRFDELRELARRLGLDFFEVMFEVVPQAIMSEIAAYGLRARDQQW